MSVKLLDYGILLNPFGKTIGKQRSLVWPVNAYRVTLPISITNEGGLNPFERVILKLLSVSGVLNLDTLSTETCIPIDLVKSIILRLQDKDFIDEYWKVRHHENNAIEYEIVPEFVTALVFRELATGKILPFLHLLDDTNPLRKKDVDDKHQSRSIRENHLHKKNQPTPRNVITALRAMNKRSMYSNESIKMPSVQQITIANLPELYHLDCPIAIQKSDGDFRIADPFNNGFSNTLESSFDLILEKDTDLSGWMNKWKQSLYNSHSSKSDKKENRAEYLFETDGNWQRYPKLISNLKPAKNELHRTIGKIHASIEWTLFYFCCQRPFNEAIALLKFTAQTEHNALLTMAAKNMGLELPQHHIFQGILEGKLIGFQNGGADFDTVFALSILQAQKDVTNPLRRFASKHLDLIFRLLSIKKRRNEKQHGKGGANNTNFELPDDSFMRELIHALLPDIQFSDSIGAIQIDKDAQADENFEARSSIQDEFGFKVFNRLGADLQSRLIHAEKFWLSCKDDDDAQSFMADIYAATQAAFDKVLAGKLPPDLRDNQLFESAENKVALAGFEKPLPKLLSTVKVFAIRQTLQGMPQTLGACVIAFVLMSDEDTLRSIAASQPLFTSDIADIHAKRGHGNEPLPLPKNDIKTLRNQSYRTIKTLLDI